MTNNFTPEELLTRTDKMRLVARTMLKYSVNMSKAEKKLDDIGHLLELDNVTDISTAESEIVRCQQILRGY